MIPAEPYDDNWTAARDRVRPLDEDVPWLANKAYWVKHSMLSGRALQVTSNM